MRQRRYPIGEQHFPSLRERGFLYIDKTDYVYSMTHSDSKYMFLNRPRRFGKSLLISTLQAYFEGNRHLFGGLAIEKLEKEWKKYPVLRFDMSLGKHQDPEALERYLLYIISDNERIHGVEGSGQDSNLRLTELIRNVSEKTGTPVVVLIDEYDAPLLDVAHEDDNLPKLRKIMRNFYSPLKACDPLLRYVFLTGITKFSQLSIFSELNNIENISMDEKYAAICGISKEEMLTYMTEDIAQMAEKSGQTAEETINQLIENYDGYHFTWPSPDIFNPFSLLTAMSKGKIDSYWFGSGTPTYLIEMLRKFDVKPMEIGPIKRDSSDFDAPTERIADVVPLLYQSGYITIKGYSSFSRLYTLDIPNKEVRIGLMRNLLTEYIRKAAPANNLAGDMAEKIYFGDLEGALQLMKATLSSLPYCDNCNTEGHYQQLLAIMFTLTGSYVDVEVRTPTGRVDMVMRTPSALYLFELKINRSADEAMRQISLKDCPSRFALTGLPIIRVGINFDTSARTISDWRIDREDSHEIN